MNEIVCGDAFEVLKGFASESVDLIVTDPPYGYSFMGKDWDKAVPSVDVWKECLRVLKSGAFAFVMSSPRQDVLSQMILRLGQAGFETGFTSIYWCYASGFPKAMNVSKMVDKKLGNERTIIGVSPNWRDSKRDREKFGSMEVRGENAGLLLGESISEEAKALDGSYGGFQLKPAVEIIIVCMKPLSEKTYVDQALKNGKGVSWLDDARIPFSQNESAEDLGRSSQGFTAKSDIFHNDKDKYEISSKSGNLRGRFPANLLVSDDALNDGRISGASITGSGIVHNENREGSLPHNVYGERRVQKYTKEYADSGSFSRYFDLDKWFAKTVENLPESVRKTFPFLICPKASKSERNQGCEMLPNVEIGHMASETGGGGGWQNDKSKNPNLPRKNFHPTVKPLKLMSYLVTLGSRPNDVVLDPFVGSGTTCLASEILSRKWIGIDNNPDYCEIARKRLATVPEKLDSFLEVDE